VSLMPKKLKFRSPNYPSIALRKAVDLAASAHKKWGAHPVPIKMLHEHWGLKPGSGLGNQAVAALKSYQLVDVVGEGDDRKVSLSKSGIRIVMGSPDREQILAASARAPKVHQEILGHYAEKGLPTDDLLKRFLVWDRPEGQRFNPEVVDEFIARFRDTLAFAKVAEADKISADAEVGGGDDGERGGDEPPEVKVGSYVQWTSGGTDQFVEPQAVRGISDDGLWAFVDCSKTGVPMSELSVIDPPAKKPVVAPPQSPFAPPPPPSETKPPAGFKEDVWDADEGRVVLRWPEKLSAGSIQDIQAWLALSLGKIARANSVKLSKPGDNAKE
jgi:hypothetical protein